MDQAAAALFIFILLKKWLLKKKQCAINPCKFSASFLQCVKVHLLLLAEKLLKEENQRFFFPVLDLFVIKPEAKVYLTAL